MKVWIKAGVIIFYVLGYCFLRKRMRRDIVKLFKAYMLYSVISENTEEGKETSMAFCLEICTWMGDANYFSRTFRKVEGISPREYRKQW